MVKGNQNDEKKILVKAVIRGIAFLTALFVSVWSSAVSHAEDNVESLGYGIIEYTDENGNIIREYNSSRVTGTYSRGLKNNEWVKEMLLVMGMRSEIVDNLSNSVLSTYAGEGRMYSIETRYQVNEDCDSDLNQSTSMTPRTPGQNFGGQYVDDHIIVQHYAWVSEDGDTIRHSTTATWTTMPTYRYTDSLGSCTQECSVRPETFEGYYAYEEITTIGSTITRKDIKVDFVGLDSSGQYTDETDFERVDKGTFSGIGVTFPLPQKFQDEFGTNVYDAEDFYVYFTYEASPIDIPVGEELNVYVTYCHTLLQVSASGSLSINGDCSITPSFAISKQKKPILLVITL